MRGGFEPEGAPNVEMDHGGVSLSEAGFSHATFRSVASWAVIAALAYYWQWRLVERVSVSLEGHPSAIPAFAAETLYFLSLYFIVRSLSASRLRHAEADAHAGWWLETRAVPPRVALLIPTYDEPAHVLERAIAGAKGQDYQNLEIWLLDDGNRDVVAGLARAYGIGYLTRATNEGAKAGNLTHAVRKLAAGAEPPEFIAVLDSDYVAFPTFVSRTLALMYDQRTALVQTPQSFYNPDHFQSSLADSRLPSFLRFSYEIRLPAMDAAGAAVCVGTSFVVRRTALESIGGFATDAVTEDILTSIRLRRRGWKVVFLREPLSLGLATEGLAEFLTQRSRWALGFTQMARSMWRDGASQGLLTRLLATDTYLRHLYAPILQVTMVLVPPILYAFLGWAPFSGPVEDALAHALPFLVLHRAFMHVASEGTVIPIYNEAIAIVGTPATVAGMIRFLKVGARGTFNVTPKGRVHDRAFVHWRTALFVALWLCLSVATLVMFAHRLWEGDMTGRDWLMAGWGLYGLLCLLVAAIFSTERPRRRREARYPGRGESLSLTTLAGRQPGRMVDISADAIAITLPDSRPHRHELATLDVQDVPSGLAARVVRWFDENGVVLAFEPTPAQREAIIRKVYSLRYVQVDWSGGWRQVLAACFVRICRVRRQAP